MKNYKICLLVCLLFSPVSVAKQPQQTTLQKNLHELVYMSVGEFNNHQQIESLKQTNNEEQAGYSQLHHIRKPIESPSLEGYWIYAQINREDSGGEIYRQSYSHYFIDEGVIKSRAYSLKEKSKEKKAPNQALLSGLKPSQLKPKLTKGCDTQWRRELDQFIGLTDHKTCVIQSKYKNEKRGIFAEEIIGKSGFWGREGGYTQDGELAFGLEAPNYYRYQRVK